jgi:hypothetical protein
LNVTVFGEGTLELQKELIHLQENQIWKTKFTQLSCSSFWARLSFWADSLMEVKEILLPFLTKYICKAGFSSILMIKTKARNSLYPQHDLHCILDIDVKPRFDQLTEKITRAS